MLVSQFAIPILVFQDHRDDLNHCWPGNAFRRSVAVTIRYPEWSPSLLLPNPDLLTAVTISRLHLPNLQLIRPSIAQPCIHIERPTVSRARNARAENDTKVLNVI